jgi:formylglycine-generating enzyme required for sulfatase activity
MKKNVIFIMFLLLAISIAACKNPFFPEKKENPSTIETVVPSFNLAYDMVLLEAGTFGMGIADISDPYYSHGDIVHGVKLTKGFYLGKYEVTQKEYETVMGKEANQSFFSGSNLPVENINWYDAIVFCNILSMMEDLTPVYSIGGKTNPEEWGTVPTESPNTTWDAVVCNWDANGYRLPTEAEWEYACRAGTTTLYSTGSNITTDQANYNGNWSNKLIGLYREETVEVGSFDANSWGLFDMHGNIREWCWDWHKDYPTLAWAEDPKGDTSGTYRIQRGGSWNDDGILLMSAFRFHVTNIYLSRCLPSDRNKLTGFRLARNIN